MRARSWLLLAILSFAAGACGSSAGSPNSTTAEGGTGPPAQKRGPAVPDESPSVRSALEECYARMARAYLNGEGPEPVLALRTPDFSVHMPNGDTWGGEQAASYVRASFRQVEKTLEISFQVAELTVEGNRTVAVIHQRWKRLQEKAGQRREVETDAVQRETWLKTAGGWRLQRIDDIHPGVWLVDGKRVDPSRPYDPDAPPFVPERRP